MINPCFIWIIHLYICIWRLKQKNNELWLGEPVNRLMDDRRKKKTNPIEREFIRITIFEFVREKGWFKKKPRLKIYSYRWLCNIGDTRKFARIHIKCQRDITNEGQQTPCRRTKCKLFTFIIIHNTYFKIVYLKGKVLHRRMHTRIYRSNHYSLAFNRMLLYWIDTFNRTEKKDECARLWRRQGCGGWIEIVTFFFAMY